MQIKDLINILVMNDIVKELIKAQKKVEEQAQRLKERQEQCCQLEAFLKEYKDKLLASEQHGEKLEGLNKVSVKYVLVHVQMYAHCPLKWI